MRVLLVDDSAIIRERLAEMLSELPRSVELIGQAPEASKATETIRKLKPDVVILDIRMPGKSGIDVLREIKRESPSPVVLMLTNCSYRQYRDTCIAVGADFFLDKSTEFEQIPQILRRLIRNRRVPLTPALCA